MQICKQTYPIFLETCKSIAGKMARKPRNMNLFTQLFFICAYISALSRFIARFYVCYSLFYIPQTKTPEPMAC